jgi:diguanylate cyclase (GGDEF)-like protein
MEAELNTLRRPFIVVSSRQRLGDLAKRAVDVSAAAFGLVILSPLFLLIGILIKRDSPGPVFYHGIRVGRKGRLFWILKFRTMYEEISSYEGPRLTSREDTRVTPLGKWLRNTKLNELPQLWNVLRGEMSLVGPRPEDPEIIELYDESVRNEILSVRPGITSPASVLYHAEETLLSNTNLMGTYLNEILPDKLRLDQLYVRNRSVTSDLDIVFWTLAIFITRLARIEIPEGYLFAGPLTRLIHRHFSWFVIDSIMAFVAACAATVIWRTQGPLDWGWNYLAILSLCIALLFSTVNYLTGLNRIVWSRATGEDAFGLFFSAGFATLLALVLDYLQGKYRWMGFPALPMGMVLSVGVLASTGFFCARYRFSLLTWLAESWSSLQRNERGVGERVLILGDGETCKIASWLLRQGMFRHAFSIIGVVASEDPTKQGMRLSGCRVMGGIRDLQAIIKQYDVRMIVYTLPSAEAHIRNMIFEFSMNSSVRLLFLDDLMTFVSRRTDKPTEAREYLDWLQQRGNASQLRDALTGLPNAALLQDRIQHSLAYARRYKTNAALILMDFNGFNGTRTANLLKSEDELVTMASKRLMTFKRESDTLARFGVHGFALLLENIPDKDAAERIYKRTKALISDPFLIGKNSLSMQADVELHFPIRNIEEIRERLQLTKMKKASPKARPSFLKSIASSKTGN